MNSSRAIIGAAMAVVFSLSATEGGYAMSIYGDPSQAARNDDGLSSQVAFRHGGGGGGGMHRGGGAHQFNRGVNMNHNVNRNVNINRNVNRNVNVNRHVGVAGGIYRGGAYHGAWVGRSYRWAPGAAIAAGAAIGFVAYGTALAWAPPPPQPGLCWYYKDTSQRNGFWDSCP